MIQKALERTGAKPQVVSGNGTQFTASEFRDLVKRFGLEHIWIRTYHPELNGRLERYTAPHARRWTRKSWRTCRRRGS